MADTVIIGGFDRNALNILDYYLGKDAGTTRNDIVSASKSSNGSSNGNNNLDEIDKQLEKLKQKIADNESDLKYTKTKKYREEETDAKARREMREAIKQQNDEYREQIKLLEQERSLAVEQIRLNRVINQDMDLRNKLIAQHNKYVQENLEKYEAIAAQKEKIATYGQKVDDKVETLSHGNIFGLKKGKKNSFAELFQGFGNVAKKIQSSLQGETLGRNIGKVLNGAVGITSKAGAFINEGKMDVGGIADKVSGKLAQSSNPYAQAAGGILQILKTMFEMYSKVNTAASKFAKTVGGGGEAIREMEMRLSNVAVDLTQSEGKWVSWNQHAYDAAKLLETMAEYSGKLGRNTQYMSEANIGALQDIKDWGVDLDFVNQFDTFGVQASEVSKKLANLYGTAGRHGLNAKAVTDTVVKNMKMAQQYTFAGGQKALERMAEKSVALKYNMESVAKFADKVSTLEGAAKTGAELSVLGGDFARMGNPLSLLYGGLQDPERLNDMMLNMTKNMAYWNSDKGQMDITAQNRMRLRAAATSMGIDVNDLFNQAYGQGKRNIIDNDLGYTSLDDETREFVRNIAEIKDGKAVVNLKTGKKDENGNDIYQEKLVSLLNEQDRKQLKEESEKKDIKEGSTIGDLIIQTRSTQEKLDEILEQIKAKLVKGVMALVNKFVFGSDQYSMMHGFSDEETAQYERIKRILDDRNVNKKDYINATDADKAMLVKMGIFNDSGEYIGKTERSGTWATYNWGETADLYAKALRESNNDKKANGGEIRSKEPSSRFSNGGTIENKQYGGEIRGKGTSKSDSILALASGGNISSIGKPIKVSDGEFVVNAKAAQKHMSELKAINADGLVNGGPIRTGNNSTNYQHVNSVTDESIKNSLMIPPLNISPININVSGTINLSGSGGSKSVDAKDLITNTSFIAQLVRKIEESINYGLDKRHVHMKYPEPVLFA